MKAEPSTLAPHGTFIRARICSPLCSLCQPKRDAEIKRDRARRQRITAYVREGKRAQGRTP